ncbi:outer membrane protein [Bartonella sp. F02]|uniref:outer membrane protein n=1 Tax=Bartonella sp. F02 TaxID=2967262 RepID=UPI0022A8DF1F|nr:outer membrane protein [Bartonella sp. F02]MCZ2328093.1 porin family protein [Bartonella sp. F02]
MNIKTFMTASVFALATASVAQAADIMIPRQPTEIAPPVVVAPTFSWTGFYLGGQIGSFSSKTAMDIILSDRTIPLSQDALPKLSGFVGGLYAGSNVDLGNNFILGVDTDMVWSGQSKIKPSNKIVITNENKGGITQLLTNSGVKLAQDALADGDVVAIDTGFKEEWSGATRVRFGFAADRIMPYVAGGVAYARFQDVAPVKASKKDTNQVIASGKLSDETKTLVGYTLGAGVDFAMTDSVILRAEYRYADFGKKKFANDKYNINYKTNNFRVGVAYKF